MGDDNTRLGHVSSLVEDALPCRSRTSPDILKIFTFRHLDGFGMSVPAGEFAGISSLDFGFKFAFPESMSDLAQIGILV